MFEGRKRVTVYEYGPGARIARAVTDAEWLPEDQESALALLVFEAGLCSGCRDELAETTKVENFQAYVPQLPPLRCHRCTAQIQATEQIEKNNHPQPGALMVSVVHRKDLPPPEES